RQERDYEEQDEQSKHFASSFQGIKPSFDCDKRAGRRSKTAFGDADGPVHKDVNNELGEIPKRLKGTLC
ncbi:hypothetical protein, partial [Paenibacillus contaminans]